MEYKDLLDHVKTRITDNLISEFNNAFRLNQFDRTDNINKCRIDYLNYTNTYKTNMGSNSNDFIAELQQKGFLATTNISKESFDSIEIRSALSNFKRFLLLKAHGDFTSFQDKVEFVLNNSDFFTLFQLHDIPSYGNFICSPNDNLEKEYLINEFETIITKLRIRLPYKRDGGNIFNIRESFICEISLKNYEDKVKEYMQKMDSLYNATDGSDSVKLCHYLMSTIKEANLDLFEFLKFANDPLIYYSVLISKNRIHDIIDFQCFLDKFNWDVEMENILNTQTNQISIVNLEYPPVNFYQKILDSNSHFVYYNNPNRFNFLNKMKEHKIFISDMILVDSIISKVIHELEIMNFLDINLLKVLIEYINTKVKEFYTPKLEYHFFTYFLNAYSKQEILGVETEVWANFKLFWMENRTFFYNKDFEIESNQNNSNNSNQDIKGSTYTPIQLQVLDFLADSLTLLIKIKIDEHKSKERLSFSACLSEDEKVKYIKKEIKKYQNSISKCPPDIAEFCHGYLVMLNIDSDQSQVDEMYHICSNYIQQEFYELLENAHEDFPTIEDVNKMDDTFWESFLLYEYEGNDGILERKNVKSFIKFMALTDLNLTFKEILIEIKDDNNKDKLIFNSDKLDIPINDLNPDDLTPHSKNRSHKTSLTNMHISFKYKNINSKIGKVTDLMNYLIKKNLIDKDTSLNDFRCVFSNTNIVNKIVWHGNISELAHFIKTLHNTANKVEDTKQKQWEITINCFVIPSDPLPLTKSRLRGQKNPATRGLIEEAVNLL